MATPLASTASPGSRAARRPGTIRRALLSLAAVLGVLVLLAAVPAQAAASDPKTSEEAAALVAARGHDLEVVTEQFNEARERLKAQQAAVAAAEAALEKARAEVAVAQQAVRGIARSAFTSGGMSSFHALLTSDSADEFVDRVGVLQKVADHQNKLLHRAASASVTAGQAQAEAVRATAEAQATYDKVAAQQTALQGQIAEYQALYEKLSAAEKQAALAAAAAAHSERASRAERSAPAAAAPAPAPAASAPIVANSQAAQIAVDIAMAQRGKPYVWAAAGPGAFDCSGLTMYAYAAAGIGLPHSSAMQGQTGRSVPRDQLQPGDLVFFYSPVSHVGIYIGNGQMVHAPTSGDVVRVADIDSMGNYSHATRIAG